VRAEQNLRREAEARGVPASRLVFAAGVPLDQHLARHRAADLFLDSFPYTAHTTANDALYAGLPVLTRAGDTYVSRVGASLLKAIGLEELIAYSAEEYERIALELARDRGGLNALRAQLMANRETHPLFDTPRFARHIEDAYAAMHKRALAGLAPDHIEVAPLR
jgi:predicted O-linked N-acetylglucosamine transferase (SPINDLY family)